jgi:hypothetical protein
VSTAIAVLTLVHSAVSRHVPWSSVTGLALGVWSVFTPVVLGYDAWQASTTAMAGWRWSTGRRG